MSACELIEEDEAKSDALDLRLDRGDSINWRGALYRLGFIPFAFDGGDRFPTGLEREWLGQDVVVHYLYAANAWTVRVNGKTLGGGSSGMFTDFRLFMDYLNDEVLVADVRRFQ